MVNLKQYLLSPGIGVLVSLVLFWLGYRRTVGAKQERSRAANAEFERTVLSRVVHESYSPTLAELEVLAEGFAREHNVRDADIESPSEVLISVYTSVMSLK